MKFSPSQPPKYEFVLETMPSEGTMLSDSEFEFPLDQSEDEAAGKVLAVSLCTSPHSPPTAHVSTVFVEGKQRGGRVLVGTARTVADLVRLYHEATGREWVYEAIE